MPRIRQRADAYAEADFWESVAHRQVELGIRNDAQLAARTGITRQTLGNYRRSVSEMYLSNFRKIVSVLSPDIAATLRFLGYTPQEIKKFKEGRKENPYET